MSDQLTSCLWLNRLICLQNKTRKELHEKVKQAVHGGTNQPICIKNVAKDEVPDDNTKLRDADCMYDGATLVSEIRAPWSLMVLISGGRGGSQTLTVTVPAVWYNVVNSMHYCLHVFMMGFSIAT